MHGQFTYVTYVTYFTYFTYLANQQPGFRS